jgi:hypothetical protein
LKWTTLPDNPGIYEPFAFAVAWPFIPALGLVISIGLVAVFALYLIGLRERVFPVWQPMVVGLLAIAVSALSVIGLLAASDQWAAGNADKYAQYETDVQDWIAAGASVDVSEEQTRDLLARQPVTFPTGSGPVVLLLTSDRSAGVLVLDIFDQALEKISSCSDKQQACPVPQ